MYYRNSNDVNSEPTDSFPPVQTHHNFSQDAGYGTVPQPALYSGNNVKSGRPASRGLRTGAIAALALVLLLVFGVGLFAGWQFARAGGATVANNPNNSGLQSGNTTTQPTIPPLSGNNSDAVREAVIAKVRPSVVQINVTTARGGAIGSGVIIDKRGYIVTNNHVVSGAQSIEVELYNGTRLTAQLTGTDPADDLAVVKINPPSNMVVATIGNSSNLKVGQEVLAIGNPLGNTQTVTNGIISALNRTVEESGNSSIPNAIQTDAPINPGNSGGALVDMQGNLIGIPTVEAVDPEFNTPANGVGFAIPSNRVSYIVPQIINNGSVTHTGRAALNVGVADVDANVQAQDNLAVGHGALIANIQQGGAAARAGLQVGDVIVQLGNMAVNDSASLGDALSHYSPGQQVQVKVYRGNQELTINVTLGELQSGA